VTDCLDKAQHKNKKSLLLNVPHIRPEVLMVMAVLRDVMADRDSVWGKCAAGMKSDRTVNVRVMLAVRCVCANIVAVEKQ